MKKLVFLSLALLFFQATTVLPVKAEVQCQKTNGYISVNSSKTKDVEPNVAELTFSVETNAKTAESASNSNKVAVSKIMNAIKPVLDIKNGDVIKTSGFSVRPNYSYPKNQNKVIEGYTVVNSVVIKTKKVSNAGYIIDLAIKNGANRLDSLNFSLENQNSIGNDLYPDAVKDAYTQASIVAKALNTTIVGIKSVNASTSVDNPDNMRLGLVYAKAAMDSSESVTTPVEAGKIRVTVTVSAEFEVR